MTENERREAEMRSIAKLAGIFIEQEKPEEPAKKPAKKQSKKTKGAK